MLKTAQFENNSCVNQMKIDDFREKTHNYILNYTTTTTTTIQSELYYKSRFLFSADDKIITSVLYCRKLQ